MAAVDFKKDPSAVLDYGFDWSDWLSSGETISTSTWTASVGITIDSDTKSLTSTVVWLSGGTSGIVYTVINHIVTSGGKTDERSLNIRVTNR